MRKPAAVPIAFALFVSSWFSFSGISRAEEPFLKKDDVIAIVGGEDMVAMSEYGYLELLLTRALPEHRLKFRCLAWEGDTVFEQRRDLNFPTLEQQLEQIGATVMICQFGQMESIESKPPPLEFAAAYEKLIGRLNGERKRRVALVAPTPFSDNFSGDFFWTSRHFFHAYSSELEKMADRLAIGLIPIGGARSRNRLHLDKEGHFRLAQTLGRSFLLPPMASPVGLTQWGEAEEKTHAQLITVIRAKNRLWTDYFRVQNWAFLAGDRTNQPSSRDHLDASKRWFPEERERFLPLIEKKEQEIWALAAKLGQP